MKKVKLFMTQPGNPILKIVEIDEFDLVTQLRNLGYTVEAPYSDPELKLGDIVQGTTNESPQRWIYLPTYEMDSQPFMPLTVGGYLMHGTYAIREDLPKQIEVVER